MPPVNLAIAGLGFMGATHARAVMSLDNVRLAAVVSKNEKKLSGDLRDVGGNLGVKGELMDFSGVKKFRSVDEALADPEIDAVDICLPTDLHAPTALAVLRAGKHVLVEKPMALTAASAEEVLREAQERGRILMTGQVLRFFPAYVEAARLVRSGALGAIRMSWFRRNCAKPSWGRWITDTARSGGGIFDLLIHDVDYSIWLFGEPASIRSALSGGLISATFTYSDPAYSDPAYSDTGYSDTGYSGPPYSEPRPSGSVLPTGPVIVEGGWHAEGPYPFSMSFTIAGENGTLEFSSAGCPLTLWKGGATESEIVKLPDMDSFQEELRYFADCVASNRQPEKCPPRESATAVKVALQMLQTECDRL